MLRRYNIVRLALFLYVKQLFTNIYLWKNDHIGTLFACKLKVKFPFSKRSSNSRYAPVRPPQ